MDKQDILSVLSSVRDGVLSPEDALLKLKLSPFEDIGYAKIDSHRAIRQGVSEVIYGAGKTAEQIIGIVRKMKERDEDNILITRLSPESAELISASFELEYHPIPKLGIVDRRKFDHPHGKIVVCSGGTSDMPVCEEAAFTAEVFGNRVVRLYDVGVAGLHRLLSRLDELMDARAVIAVAGMEGALASVVGGLVDCPVIAVPTSVGYGANFGGLSALLSMLNSCASGVSVVNIDNGFGAGYLANMINKTQSAENR